MFFDNKGRYNFPISKFSGKKFQLFFITYFICAILRNVIVGSQLTHKDISKHSKKNKKHYKWHTKRGGNFVLYRNYL